MISLKLLAFRIQNYRSIKDSGWRNLAHDNITILIGQNESGKTSVLEALQSFYDNCLNEDVLRSDNSFPVVSCRFKIDNSLYLCDLLEKSKIHPKLWELIKDHTEFVLSRIWDRLKRRRPSNLGRSPIRKPACNPLHKPSLTRWTHPIEQ